ncbi:hypothetical protein GCM10010923_02830 [Blastomonas marina]|uniref:GDT1 family protein n=1 Tax=Blastomonas marina TaxID=1867408 RepID=A0ABQ1F2Z6_9SPHN|nr:hypothetical protein [Blastomonas marina]GFZ98153.1 hypothetical protein GCM10010923_02830 [Blastomonas marina]
MAALMFAFVAAFLVTMGARDQVLVSDLSAKGHGAALPVGVVAGWAASALAGYGAGYVLPALVPDARDIIGAVAAIFSGLELLLLRPGRAPKEPTHSVGAASLVLIAHQITDAARFLAFGIGAAYAAAIPAAMGCAAGGTMALGLGALGVVDPRARWIAIGRRIFAVVLLVLGLWLGWQALPD